MAMTVNTNIPSLNAQRNLGKSQGMLDNSLQRLSSGLRINSAKDDAAGLAIANRMTSQIRGLDQAVRNANDGISLAQTAEGALQESGNILQRIRELAIQSSSDGSTDTDRASMQIEVDQLVAELDRIASTTSFNSKVLLDGSFGTSRFQIGAEAGETVSMTMTSAKTADLGAVDGDGVGDFTLTKLETSEGAGLVDTDSLDTLASGDLTINGTSIRATSSGDDLVSSTDNAGSAIAIAAAINASADTTGVLADVQANTFDLGQITNDDGIDLGEFQINGVDITGDNEDSEEAFAALINAKTSETGVSAVGVDDTSLILTAADGRNIQLTTNGTAGALEFANFDCSDGALDKVQRAEITLYSNEAITIAGSNPDYALGLGEGTTALTTTSWVTEDTTNTFDDLSAGDLTINGYNVDAPDTDGDENGDSASNIDGGDSAKAIAYAINQTTGLNEQVEASAITKANLGTVSAYADGDLTLKINGSGAIAFTGEIQDNDADGYMVDKLNAVFKDASAGDAYYGLVASKNGSNELVITSSDGVNVDVEITADSDTKVFSAVDTTTLNNHVVHKGTVSLTAKDGYSVGTIGGEKQALAGISDEANVTIASVSVATFEDAQTAIESVDTALGQIDDQRAELGAIQNRFDSTINNLSTTSENLAAARARIMDADFAAETADLTKAQIMQQAGTAMLAQANQLPQQVLSLLQ
jgi:flagellin